MTTTNSKTFTALSALSSTYAEREKAATAELRARAEEAKKLIDAFVLALASGEEIHTDGDNAAVHALLGPYTVATYRRDVDAARAYEKLLASEKSFTSGKAERKPTSNGTIPSVADKLNATPLAAVQPKTSNGATSAPSKPGVVRLVGHAAWNFHSLAKEVRDASASAGWNPAKLSQFRLKIAGIKTHAELLAASKKAGLAIESAS